MMSSENKPYDPAVTAKKGAATTATVGGFGILFVAVFYLIRNNTGIVLWPEDWDALVIVAMTAALSSVIRMINNWRKPRGE